jgi:hypothetical protein
MKYIKTFENKINEIELAKNILASFYADLIPNCKFNGGAIWFGSTWMVKTYGPSNIRNYMQDSNVIQIFHHESSKYADIQMNIKLFFDNFLGHKLDESDKIISNGLSAFNFDKVAKIIIDNKDELSIENFELFSNVKKYNL